MNRNQILLIIVPFLLIFGYQNCQKSSFDPAETSLKNSSESTFINDKQTIPLQNEKLERLQFKVMNLQNGLTVKNSYPISSTKHDVDLMNGVVYVTHPGQNDLVAVKYCLTPDLLKIINSLLYSDSICISSPPRKEGSVCSQVLKEGYASLMTNRDEFELGSATDSCGSRTIDLCQNSEKVKSWIEMVKSQSPVLNCKE